MRKWIPLAIFLLALTARLLGILVVDIATDMPQAGFDRPSCREFARLATNMLAGRGFSYFMVQGQWVPSAYMPPTYAFVLAGVFAVLGRTPVAFVCVQVIQAGLGAATAVLVYLIARRLFGPPVGLLAGLIYACGYPVLIYAVVEVHTVALYVLLNCLVAYLLLRLTEPPERALRPAWAGLAGAAMGLVALSTAEALAYIPLLTMWPFLVCSPRRALRIALPFGLVAVLVLVPWTARNYAVFHRLVPVRAWGGFNLWRGQNEFTTGSGYAPVPGGLIWSTPEIAAQVAALPYSQDWEARVDDIYLAEALTFMREHPWRSLSLVPHKLFYYWIVDLDHPQSSHPLYWLPWAVYGPLFVLGAVLSKINSVRGGTRSAAGPLDLAIQREHFRPTGCAPRVDISLSRRPRPFGPDAARPWLLYLYIITGSVLVSIFFVLPRYRLFIEPFIVVFAAYGLWRMLSFLRGRGVPLTDAILHALGSLANDVQDARTQSSLPAM